MKLFKPLTLSLTLIAAAISSNAEERPTRVELVRPLGMGGAFTALADDQNVFNYNPAGMVQRTGTQFTLFDLTAGASKDTKDAVDFVSDNEDEITDIDHIAPDRRTALINEIRDNIQKLYPRVYIAGAGATVVSGPSFFGIPVHVGFGITGASDNSFSLEPGPIFPSVSFDSITDVIIPLSIAKRFEAPFLPGMVGFGLTGKLINRKKIDFDHMDVTTLDDLDSPPIQEGDGFGGDFGVLYEPTDRTNIGIMVQDIGGTKMSFDKEPGKDGYPEKPAYDTVIRPRTNVGVAIQPETLLWLLPTGERWTFAADIRDVLNDDESLFFQRGFKKPAGDELAKHIHMGAEFRYWFFRFRGGAYQGYPTLGLGLDFPLFKLDASYYGMELGSHAGEVRQDNFALSLALTFGSGGVESRERIKKNKEMKNKKNAGAPEFDAGPAEPPATSTPENPPAAVPESQKSEPTKPAAPAPAAEEIPN